MKTVKKILLVLFVVISIISVSLLYLYFKFVPQGNSLLTNTLNAVNPFPELIQIKADSIDKGFFGSFKLNEVYISSGDNILLEVEKVDLSIGVLDLYKLTVNKFDKPINIKLTGINLNLDQKQIDDLIEAFKNRNAEVPDLSFNVALYNVNAKISYNGYALDVISADVSFKYSEETLSDVSFFSPNAVLLIDEIHTNASVENFNFSSSDLKSMNLSLGAFNLNLNEQLVFASSLSASADKVQEGFNINFSFPEFSYNSTDGYSVILYESWGEVFILDSFDVKSVKISSSAVNEKGLLEEFSSKLGIQNVVLDFIVEKEIFSVSTEFRLKGDFFSTDVDLHVEGYDFDLSSLTSLDVLLSDTRIETFPLIDSVQLGFVDNLINVEIKSGKYQANLLYGLEKEVLLADLNLKDFVPNDYRQLYNQFFPQFDWFISDNTLLNGVLSSRIDLSEPVLNLNFDVNLNAENLSYNDNCFSFEVEAAGSLFDKQLKVDSSEINALGYVVEYSGEVNLNSHLPDGRISVLSESTGEEYASFSFVYNQSDDFYSYTGQSSKLANLSLSGTASFDEENGIVLDSVFETKFQVIPLHADLNIKNRTIFITNPGFILNAYIEDNTIYGNLEINNVDFKISDENSVFTSGEYVGQYNLSTHEYSGSIEDFKVLIDGFGLIGFDVAIQNGLLEISDVSLGKDNDRVFFDGSCFISYESIFNFINDTKKLNGKLDLVKRDSEDYIKASLVDKSYEASVYLNLGSIVRFDLLGQRDKGFFANFSIGDVSFEARYLGKRIELYQGSGKIGSFDIEDFNFDIDYNTRSLNGFFILKNILDNLDGPVVQGGRIDISAKLDSINLAAFSVGNIDAKAEIDVSVSQTHFGDDFKIKDNSFTLSFSNQKLYADGNLIKGYVDFSKKYFEVDLNKELLIGGRFKGVYGNELDIFCENLYIPIPIINQFINFPFFVAKSGILTGNLLVKGPLNDPSMYGMLYSQSFEMGLFWIPFQTLTLKNLAISLVDHDVNLCPVNVIGFSELDGRLYDANFKLSLTLDKLKVIDLDMNLFLGNSPMDFWLPIKSGDLNLNIRVDVTGKLDFKIVDGDFKIIGDILTENGEVTFKFPDFTPPWFDDVEIYSSTDLRLTTGKNVDFYYPDKDNSLLNFTTEENDVMHLVYDSRTEELSANGKFAFKTGEIFYIQNSFKITEGDLTLVRHSFDTGIGFNLNLRAKLREYDADGIANDIYLVLNNSSFDNLNPKFESDNGLSENEIIQLIGKPVFSSVTSLATAASDTARKFGFFQTNNDYSASITNSIRNSLKLDIFSLRSSILENVILESLPGRDSNYSLLSRYLNGTSLFAGKYLKGNTFARMSVLLKSSKKSNTPQFLTDDLSLDLEFSFDWENPVGSFSVFIQPNELSVMNFLDTIGFSITKTIKF